MSNRQDVIPTQQHNVPLSLAKDPRPQAEIFGFYDFKRND